METEGRETGERIGRFELSAGSKRGMEAINSETLSPDPVFDVGGVCGVNG